MRKREMVAWSALLVILWILVDELGIIRFWLVSSVVMFSFVMLAALDADQFEERVMPPLDGCTCGFPARRPCDHRGWCVHSGYGEEWQDG
jgi:hypothetical protein